MACRLQLIASKCQIFWLFLTPHAPKWWAAQWRQEFQILNRNCCVWWHKVSIKWSDPEILQAIPRNVNEERQDIEIYINNFSTRCNTKQSIYYSTSSLYMFRVSATPIIGNTQNCNYSLRYWSCFLCNYLPPTWPSLATLEGGSYTVPGAEVTVLCNPDGGCDWHPKHVEWTCRIINRLLCVPSRWTIINIDQRCKEP